MRILERKKLTRSQDINYSGPEKLTPKQRGPPLEVSGMDLMLMLETWLKLNTEFRNMIIQNKFTKDMEQKIRRNKM